MLASKNNGQKVLLYNQHTYSFNNPSLGRVLIPSQGMEQGEDAGSWGSKGSVFYILICSIPLCSESGTAPTGTVPGLKSIGIS